MKKNNLSKGVAIDDEGLKNASGGGNAIIATITDGERRDEKVAFVGSSVSYSPDRQNAVYRNDYNTDQDFIEAIIKKDKELHPGDGYTTVSWSNRDSETYKW